MEIFLGVIVGLVVLVFLIVAHELGHAIAGIKSGVVLEEFGVGFPPRAWGKKLKNGTHFSLNWLPLGGFVKFQGEYDSADQKGDYGAASFWQKTVILLAGVVMNWVIAALLLTALAWTSGIPNIVPQQFYVASDSMATNYPVEAVEIMKGSPAEKAGLKAGDEIVSLAGTTILTPGQLSEEAKVKQGEEVALVYRRDGKEMTVKVHLNDDKAAGGKSYIGIAMGQRTGVIKAGWSAPITGVVTTIQLSGATLSGVKDLAVNTVKGIAMKVSSNEATRKEASKDLESAASSVAGPVGILGIIFPAATEAGLPQVVFLTAIISLTLAVMNILPIPALDGGRWFTMALFRVLRKSLTKEREEKIQGTGFTVLIVLIVVVTVLDVGKLL